MRQIQASEAKTHLSRLLDEVERGAVLIITRHGRPIARLSPETDNRRDRVERAITNIQALRKKAGRCSVTDLLRARDEGRKY